MTNEELQKKLDSLKIKLSEATKDNDTQLIDKYVDRLNDLWDKASVEMLKNAEDGGFYTPDKPS
tara:strand:- start:404 stop:595 length:192 start_codon:yes stop_codon:yes gene_type:complete